MSGGVRVTGSRARALRHRPGASPRTAREPRTRAMAASSAAGPRASTALASFVSMTTGRASSASTGGRRFADSMAWPRVRCVPSAPASMGAAAEKFARAVRHHVRVKDRLHRRLDVAFVEDGSRVREGSAPRGHGHAAPRGPKPPRARLRQPLQRQAHARARWLERRRPRPRRRQPLHLLPAAPQEGGPGRADVMMRLACPAPGDVGGLC